MLVEDPDVLVANSAFPTYVSIHTSAYVSIHTPAYLATCLLKIPMLVENSAFPKLLATENNSTCRYDT
jgi:hypothetical protein